MTIIKNQSLAEEITQNTFYKAMTSKKKFAGKSSEYTWLCSIAKRLSIDEYRKNSKTEELEDIIPAGDDITKQVEDQNMALQIHLVLHEMPEPYKEIFQLRIFGELSFDQIGRVFGKSENWARVTYHRARLKIKERIGEYESKR